MKYLFLILSAGILLISCSSNPATIDNSVKKYFDSANVEGTYAFLNNQLGDISVYNMKMDTTRISPGNFFKIAETLIGFETSRLVDAKTTLKDPEFPANDSITLKEAFDSNNTRYFQLLADKIGQDTLRFWIDSLKYGNMNMATLDSFWLNGELKISPDEQLGLLYKIYFEKLPLQKYAQQILQTLLLREDNTLYKLSYTTSTAVNEHNEPVAWIGGWIEENRHVYFFVSAIKPKDGNRSNLEQKAVTIIKSILAKKGFFKGEK